MIDRAFLAAVAAAALLLAAGPASGVDGASASPPEEGESVVSVGSSYYEDVLEAQGQTKALGADTDVSLEMAGASAAGLPIHLHVVEAAGSVRYRSADGGGFEVTLEVGPRPHERVDTLYDLVLALPLPAGFRSESWRIPVRERLGSTAPVWYGGEPVSLRRNRGLERSWLPLLVGSAEGLPDLSDRGFTWTLWDTIVRYDAKAGTTLQGVGSLRYSTASPEAVLDPDDPRSAAYLITWVPSLDAAVAPFTLRLDVVEP